MKSFDGTALTPVHDFSRVKYQVVDALPDYRDEFSCVLVKALHPDYVYLFESVRLIVTEQGGALSHLAVLAREYGISVLRVPGILAAVPREGVVSTRNSTLEVAE